MPLADTKANIMISINGIVMSIILASISPKIDANPWLVLPTSVLLVGCMGSMVFAILAARPRVSSHQVTLQDVRANRSNILFFGNFVNLSESDFVEGLSELLVNTEQLYVNMMRDLYSLGGVLNRKFAPTSHVVYDLHVGTHGGRKPVHRGFHFGGPAGERRRCSRSAPPLARALGANVVGSRRTTPRPGDRERVQARRRHPPRGRHAAWT